MNGHPAATPALTTNAERTATMASDILNTPPRPRKGIVATLVDGIRRRLNSRWPWLLAVFPVGLLTGFFHHELVAVTWLMPWAIILATSIAMALAVTPRSGSTP